MPTRADLAAHLSNVSGKLLGEPAQPPPPTPLQQRPDESKEQFADRTTQAKAMRPVTTAALPKPPMV